MNFYVERTFDDDDEMSNYSYSSSPKNRPSYGINKAKSTLGQSIPPHQNMKQMFHSTPIAGPSNHVQYTVQPQFRSSLHAQEMKKLQSQSQDNDVGKKVLPGYLKDPCPATRQTFQSAPFAGPSNHVQFKTTLGQSILAHQNMKQIFHSAPIASPSNHVQFKPTLGQSTLSYQNMKKLHQSTPIARSSDHVQFKPTLGQSIHAHQNMKHGPSNHVQYTVQENHFRSPYSSLHAQETKKLQSQTTAETSDLITHSIQDNSSIAKVEEMKLIARHAASGQEKEEGNSSKKAATSSRKPRSKKSTDLKTYDPEAYREKRAKNNEATRMSRERSRIKKDENRLKLAEAIERNSRIHAELDRKYKELSELEYMIALIDGKVAPREVDLICTEEVLDVEQIADAEQIVIDLDDFSDSDSWVDTDDE